jgi:hypothetical protein
LNLAYKHNAAMKWDPEALAFTGGTGDPKWMTICSRDPWK